MRNGRPIPRTISSSPTATTSRCSPSSSPRRMEASTSAGSTTRPAAMTSTCNASMPAATSSGRTTACSSPTAISARPRTTASRSTATATRCSHSASTQSGISQVLVQKVAPGRHAVVGRSRHLRIERLGRYARAEDHGCRKRQFRGRLDRQRWHGRSAEARRGWQSAVGSERHFDCPVERHLLLRRPARRRGRQCRSCPGCPISPAIRTSCGRRSSPRSTARTCGVSIPSRFSTEAAAHCSSAISPASSPMMPAAPCSSGIPSAQVVRSARSTSSPTARPHTHRMACSLRPTPRRTTSNPTAPSNLSPATSTRSGARPMS